MENGLLIDHVYVCHWKKLTKRKSHVLLEMDKNNISNFSFIDIYDTEEWDKKSIMSDYPFVFDKSKHRLGLGLKDSEISLLLKHCHIIKDAANKMYRDIMILEDDVVFAEDFVNKFNRCKLAFPKNWDCVWVGSCGSKMKISDSIKVDKCNMSRCTHCYVLSFNGINKICKEISNISDAIDWYFNHMIDKCNLNNYCLNPSLASQSKNFTSSIQDRK